MKTEKPIMKIARKGLAVALLCWMLPAIAALVVVEDAYELSARDVERWPLGDTASLVVRPCDTCERVYLRVTEETAYFHGANGPQITRRNLSDARALGQIKPDASLTVFYQPDNQQVTRIVVYTEAEL